MIDQVGAPVMVALIGFGGGLMLGLAARLGRFCTLGAIEDLLYASSDTRIRMWGVAIGVAVTGSFALIGLGGLDVGRTLYLGQTWWPAASVLGGLMFGYGMALSGNCGFGALARLGGGDMRSFVVVLVMGLASYATVSGPLAHVRVWAFPMERADSAPGAAHLLGDLTGLAPAVIGIAVGLAILAFSATGGGLRHDRKALFWAIVVGLAVVSGWAGTQWVATESLGATPVVTHTFSAPPGETMLWLMTASGTKLSFGVGSVAGVLCGAFVGSLFKGHFRWEACEDPRELKRQILGAAIMGVGAVIAAGCTVGQGISAFSLLAFSAPVTCLAILAGAAIGLKQLISGFRSEV